MNVKIACPRIGIEPCSPSEFAAKINAITEFPETTRPANQERLDLTILSCMLALGGAAKCTPMSGGFMAMQSEVADIVIRQSRQDGHIEIIEFEKTASGEVQVKQ